MRAQWPISALCTKKGEGGLPQDDELAVGWYQRAAYAADPRGMAYLGDAYQFGQGPIKPDLIQAVSWHRKAADLGEQCGL